MVNQFWRPTGDRRRLFTAPGPSDAAFLLDYYGGTAPYPGFDDDPDAPDMQYPGQPMPDTMYQTMLTEAQKYLGQPYLWGGKTPPRFDCSGFVGWCYKYAGILPQSVTSYTAAIRDYCYKVPADQARPGDLCYWTGNGEQSDHIAIYIGNDQILDCSGAGVAYHPRSWHDTVLTFDGYYRVPIS